MKMNKKAYIVIALLGTIFFFNDDSTIKAKEVRGITDRTIKIGVSADLTGPVASQLVPLSHAIRYYFRYMNEMGGINGRKIKIVLEDDRVSIPTAFAVYKKLIHRDKVLAIIGPTSSTQAMALLPILKKVKMPDIPLSAGENLVRPTRRYVIGQASTHSDDVRAMFPYLRDVLKAKNPRIALVRPDTEYGKTGSKLTKEKSKEFGYEIVNEEIINYGDIDASSQVLRMKRIKPDYVFVINSLNPTVVLLRDSRKYGFSTNFLGSKITCEADVIKMTGKAAEGYIALHAYCNWFEDVPGINKMKEITLKYAPQTRPQVTLYSQGWFQSIILAEGVKRAGRNLNSETLISAIETIKDFDTGEIAGPVTFSPEDHKGNNLLKLYKADIDKGYFVPISGWFKAAPDK